jgi:hypothetical protein
MVVVSRKIQNGENQPAASKENDVKPGSPQAVSPSQDSELGTPNVRTKAEDQENITPSECGSPEEWKGIPWTAANVSMQCYRTQTEPNKDTLTLYFRRIRN